MSIHPLSAIAKRRDRVLTVLGREFVSGVDRDTLARAVEGLLEVLPRGCRYDAIYRTLTAFVGPMPPPDILRKLAWALSADLPSLKSGVPVWPAPIPTTPTTVVVQVLASKRLPRFDRNTPGFSILYRFRVVSGRGATLEIDSRLSSRFVHYLAVRPNGLGFARPPRGERIPIGRAYQHYETLVGMLIKIDLSVDDEGKTNIDNPRCSGSILAYNRALTEMRWRATFDCPFLFEHACHQCSKGQTSCPAATHPTDYVNRLCPACLENEEFDLYWGDAVCRRCSLKPKRKEK